MAFAQPSPTYPTPPPPLWERITDFAGSALLIFIALWLLFLGARALIRASEKEAKREEEEKKAAQVAAARAAQLAKIKEQQEDARKQAFKQACAASRITAFRVEDGRGKHRGSVSIEIDWTAAPGYESRLSLWKSRVPCKSPDNARSEKNSDELDFEPAGRPLRFIDTRVKDGEAIYYYAWIRLNESTLHEEVCFEKRHHVARFGETFGELAKRRIERLNHEEKLRAAEAGVKRKSTPALPPAKRELADEAVEMAASLLKAKKSIEQIYVRLDAWCEAQNLSEEDAEVIKEEVLRQLDGKM